MGSKIFFTSRKRHSEQTLTRNTNEPTRRRTPSRHFHSWRRAEEVASSYTDLMTQRSLGGESTLKYVWVWHLRCTTNRYQTLQGNTMVYFSSVSAWVLSLTWFNDDNWHWFPRTQSHTQWWRRKEIYLALWNMMNWFTLFAPPSLKWIPLLSFLPLHIPFYFCTADPPPLFQY